ncbi:MAG: antitoxin VbhA family protein [Gammaproteobacteria bacterium]|nr:antitoxin VbhA family protein [Gammaproteobacteria bacterium]MBU0884655.1 antitoxin VbhA family protein [Gammaproteobacteria bacterium]MBU1861145.1 antitoxin VbhA family protein [Gammaproteobacteria bacterium]
MIPADEEAQRRSRVAHVQATNNLAGARMSSCMSSKMADYVNGRLSSAELVAAAKARYGIHD